MIAMLKLASVVIATFNPVTVLEANGTGAIDQQRPERLIAAIEGFPRPVMGRLARRGTAKLWDAPRPRLEALSLSMEYLSWQISLGGESYLRRMRHPKLSCQNLSVIIEQRSIVNAPAGLVWARVVTAEGINDEMLPWMTMGPPRGTTLSIDTVEVGVPLGRFWLRLFGVLPFDYDHLTIAELEPGRRFHEKSTMLSMRRWEHERVVEPAGNQTTVVFDRVTFEARLPVLTPVLARVIGRFFGHRHRRLAHYFDEQR